MIQEAKIAEKILENVEANNSIKAHWEPLDGDIDGILSLTINNKKIQLSGEVKKEVRQYQLSKLMKLAKEHQPFILLAEYISPSVKEILRTENIAYVDEAGNMFINAEDNYVWIDGKKVIEKIKTKTNRAFTKAGLRVVFLLLVDNEAINMTYRKIGEYMDISLGNITNVIEGLITSGFIIQKNKNERILINKSELLRRWVDGYREILKPSLYLNTCRFSDKDKLSQWQDQTLPEGTILGGESAASLMTNYLKLNKLTVFTEDRKTLMIKWKLIPDNNGEIDIYQKFWKELPIESSKLAPPLLVYTDLINSNDQRLIETAEIIYEKYLKHGIENS